MTRTIIQIVLIAIASVLLAFLVPVVADASSLELAAGKALNNTNTKLPGYVYSATADVNLSRDWSADIRYMRMGKSQVGENAAFTTIGVQYSHGRFKYGAGVIASAAYSAAVWWDKDHPSQSCGVEGCGRRYDNDGIHFTRACHQCGGYVSAEYSSARGLGIRADYIGLRHMDPTFQGVIVQLTYTIGVK